MPSRRRPRPPAAPAGDRARGVDPAGRPPDSTTLLKKLTSNDTFVYLARSVDPAIAGAITDKFPEVGAERQDIRQYPGGSLAANVVGGIDWDGHGLLGLEDSMDSVLAGTDGSVTYDRGSDGVVIPGSYRNRHDAVDGSTVQLTIDDDIQYHVQQQVQQARTPPAPRTCRPSCWTPRPVKCWRCPTTTRSIRARTSAVRRIGRWATSRCPRRSNQGRSTRSWPSPRAIENGLTTPDEVLQVPGSIDMGGVTVSDAWKHGVMPYTTTGVLGKSSNVGTLMLSQRIGPEKYFDMLEKFGLGQRTDVGLPGESDGWCRRWPSGRVARSPIFPSGRAFR